jgi:hypothetical protein
VRFLDRRVLFGFLGAINLQKREAYVWGDGDAEMQFTTYEDTAAYTAAAALDDRSVPDNCSSPATRCRSMISSRKSRRAWVRRSP